MPKNHDPLKSVTVVLLVDNTAEIIVRGDLLSPERFRTLVRDAAYAALERDPDPTKAPARLGRPAHPVAIMDIDEEAVLRHADNGGPRLDEFEQRRVFESLGALSAFLGLSKTACRGALNYARSKGKKEATVRGVTFMMLEEAPE